MYIEPLQKRAGWRSIILCVWLAFVFALTWSNSSCASNLQSVRVIYVYIYSGNFGFVSRQDFKTKFSSHVWQRERQKKVQVGITETEVKNKHLRSKTRLLCLKIVSGWSLARCPFAFRQL